MVEGSQKSLRLDGDTIDSIDRLRERINEIFVSLETDFILLSRQNKERSKIREKLFVSTGEAYKLLCRVKLETHLDLIKYLISS